MDREPVHHIGEEVPPPGQLAEQLPGAPVRAVVGGVAALDPQRHRHDAVAADREDGEQLLQVGAVVLVGPPSHGQPEPPAQRPLPVRVLVIAVEGEGRRVVGPLVEVNAERPHRVRHDREPQRGDVGVEAAVEAAADAVVVEGRQLLRGQPEESEGMAGGPLADALEGLAGDEPILDEPQQSRGGGDPGAPVLAGPVIAAGVPEAQPPEEVVEDRQRGDAAGGQGPAGGVGRLAG